MKKQAMKRAYARLWGATEIVESYPVRDEDGWVNGEECVVTKPGKPITGKSLRRLLPVIYKDITWMFLDYPRFANSRKYLLIGKPSSTGEVYYHVERVGGNADVSGEHEFGTEVKLV